MDVTPASAGAQAVPQTATRQDRMGPRLRGVGRRAAEGAVTRAA